MNELIDYHCIDFYRLLLLRGKGIGLSDHEIHILAIMMMLRESGVRILTPKLISQYSSQPSEQIDQIMLRLITNHYLDRRGGELDFTPVWRLLLKEKQAEVKQDVNLVQAFEDGFGRSLNGIEIEFINEFKRAGYDDDMILDALKEALKSNVRNFRYVEKILANWRDYGVKKKNIPEKSTDDVSDDVKNYQWW